MRIASIQRVCRGSLLRYAALTEPISMVIGIGKRISAVHTHGVFGYDNGAEVGKMDLAKDLASLVEECSVPDRKGTTSRMELKRLLELQIKKRVKEQYNHGKFRDLMRTVIANPDTLHDAYNCIRINSNVDLACKTDSICFTSLAEELLNETFDVQANMFSISTKSRVKEVIVLPNLKLKVIQEAIRIVLEVVYRPHFSKISHGCRSGRGHISAMKYIRKAIDDPDWWFTVIIRKKVDNSVLAKLVSTMAEKIDDPSLYAIIWSMFDAQVLNLEFGGFPKGHGLPQEGVLSPILMNIYLDLLDREFYRISMKYEALSKGSHAKEGRPIPNLRSWFRRQLKDVNVESTDEEKSRIRLHCCRFMDEIFFAVSGGSKDVAVAIKLETENYLINSLHLDIDPQNEILSSNGNQGVRFLGILMKRKVKDSPAVRAVHKLKEKVSLFASQKKEAWEAGTVRIGKKWLAHGLKKVKESEIAHLADSSSTLNQISSFRKAGMETDHWYKFLMKIWMEDIKGKCEVNEEIILSKYITEPALPQKLRDSFYEFQKRAEEYVASETALTLDLLPVQSSSTISISHTELIAPINIIKKRLIRYGLTNAKGYSRSLHVLIFHDSCQIIDWFSGIVCRWLRWYSCCDNFNELKCIISNQVRMSCIRTLAAKFRMHESEVEKRFDSELSQIPSNEEIELEMHNDTLHSQFCNSDEALTYGISYSGICLLSLARMVSQSRPCTCFAMGCLAPAPCVYTLHVMERQKFPGWKTGFSSCIHPGLNRRRIGLCKQHVSDLYRGYISLQSIEFGSWK